jgi:hypothetical protein
MRFRFEAGGFRPSREYATFNWIELSLASKRVKSTSAAKMADRVHGK